MLLFFSIFLQINSVFFYYVWLSIYFLLMNYCHMKYNSTNYYLVSSKSQAPYWRLTSNTLFN